MAKIRTRWSNWGFTPEGVESSRRIRVRKYKTKNYNVVETQSKDLKGKSEKDMNRFQVTSSKIYTQKGIK